MDRRRRSNILLLAACAWMSPVLAQSPPRAQPDGLGEGSIVLYRHAEAPGTGDPPNFRLGDCSTQRNLSARGREQARQLGERLRARGVPVGNVWSSQWCRTRETADLAFPAQRQDEPAFNSFFGEGTPQAEQQTAAARARLVRWRGPGVLVVVTHQVNITALTGVYPASGEGVVLQPEGTGLRVVGRIAP